MPEIVLAPPTPVVTGAGPAPTLISAGGLTRAALPMIQIAGLSPLTECDATECRSIPVDCCIENLVFGNLLPSKAGGLASPPAISTYENDLQTWFVDYGAAAGTLSAAVTIYLQRLNGCDWENAATLNNNTYGRYYALRSIASHLTYAGYTINWGLVLKYKGIGCYRLKFVAQMLPSRPSVTDKCMASEPFKLRAWNCTMAHKTVKFECLVTGKLGDINRDGKYFDLCGMTLYDSLRTWGFFGNEKTPEYSQVITEYPNGQQVLIRDEAIQIFEFKSRLLPKFTHDRLKVYFMMADTRLISDYNRNNSDYAIKAKPIIGASGWEPEYKDKLWNRTATVTVKFKEAVQGVIKSLCCDVSTPGK